MGPQRDAGVVGGKERAVGKRKTNFGQLERKVRLMYGGKYENLDWGVLSCGGGARLVG